MPVVRLFASLLLTSCLAVAQSPTAQKAGPSEAEVGSINALYGEWSQALATRGAEGYASFFVADGSVLPPNAPPVEGRDAIRGWIQKVLDEFTTKDARLSWGPLQVANGLAVRRFTLSGLRVPKKGGEGTRFTNKYLDVLQKQPDGSWKFVCRMWSSNE